MDWGGGLEIAARTVRRDRSRVENLDLCSTKKQLQLFASLPYSKLNCVGECLAKIVWKVAQPGQGGRGEEKGKGQECGCTWWGIPSDLAAAAAFLHQHIRAWPPGERNVASIFCLHLAKKSRRAFADAGDDEPAEWLRDLLRTRGHALHASSLQKPIMASSDLPHTLPHVRSSSRSQRTGATPTVPRATTAPMPASKTTTTCR